MSGYTDHGLSPDGVLSVIRDARAHVERDHWLVGGPKRTIVVLLAEIDRLRALVASAGAVISEIGCECACDHSTEEDHDEDCDLCEAERGAR